MSSTDSRELHGSENFRVEIGPMLSENVKGVVGYRIVNKRTGVAEQETNVEAMAIRLLHQSEKYLQDVLADPLDKIGDAERKAQRGRFAMNERDFQVPD